MPTLSRVAIRMALVSLALGAFVGALLLAAPALSRQPPWSLLPLHVELLLFGWLVQLTMGVAYWILPRTAGRPSERGRPAAALIAIVSLNLGVLLAGLGPLVGLDAMLVTGRVLELLAAASFAVHAWPRVRLAVSPASHPVST